MILRRLSQSLKQQNWTAIVIEFVLLVTGVFLGIQVSNWNQQRATEAQARIFTDRLRNDLRVEAWRFAALNMYYADVTANVRKTLDGLEGRVPLSNDALVIAAYRATQYSEFVQYRATFDELTSTGNIGLIEDLKLRRMATEIYGTDLYRNVKNEGVNSLYRTEFRMRVPSHVQDVVGSVCGDHPTPINDYQAIVKSLDYACSTGLSQPEIEGAATILRADSGLVPLLRLRLANINSALNAQIMSDDVVANLKALREGKP